MGIGNLVLHAARRARAGASLEEIVGEVEDRRERQHVFAALDTLEYLRKGGRIGGAQAMLGSMLSIKPIISVLDGAVESAGRVRTRSKALRFLVDQVPVGQGRDHQRLARERARHRRVPRDARARSSPTPR